MFVSTHRFVAFSVRRACLERFVVLRWYQTKGVGDVPPELGYRLLWHKNHVAGPKMYILVDVLAVQQILELEFANLRPIRRNRPKQEDLALAAVGKATRNRDSLSHRNV